MQGADKKIGTQELHEYLAAPPTAAWYTECAEGYSGTGGLASHITDSHCHIYPDMVAPKAVKAIDRFYEGLPATHHDGTVGTILREGKEQGIDHFVVHSVATTKAQVSTINRFVADSVRISGGMFYGLGTLYPDSENTERDLLDLMELGLKGVKLHPDIQKFNADSKWAMGVYEMCVHYDLPVCVHCGDFRYDHSNPARIGNVLRSFPSLKMIGAHFGGWSVWDEAAAALADYPNLTVDTSSSFFWLEPERAKRMIRAYGSGRVMFGTDYPLWTREPEIEYLRRLELSGEEYEDILWRSCARVLMTDEL